jgi:hypothetical protein
MRKNFIIAAASVALALGALTTVFRGSDAPARTGAAVAVAAVDAADADVVVYKSPTCGCCSGWVEHMRESGYDVATVDLEDYDDLARTKAEHGVPNDLGSCHTAVVDGYTVEGHVPAAVVAKLLEERPDVRGIAVPGMPIGSPGMEGPNPQPYDVIAFRRDGSRVVYESVYPASDAR